MGIYDWSLTASENATTDSPVIMSGVRALADDRGGALTTTGTGNAYAVTTKGNVSGTGLRDGLRLLIRFDRSATAAATLDVDGTGAISLLASNGSTAGIETITGGRYGEVVYDSAAEAWYLIGSGASAPAPSGGNDTEAVQDFLNDRSSSIKDFGGQTYIIDGWPVGHPNAARNWVLSIPPHMTEMANVTLLAKNPIKFGLPLLDARNSTVTGFEFAKNAYWPTNRATFSHVTGLVKGMTAILKADNSFGGGLEDNVPSDGDPEVGETIRIVDVIAETNTVVFDRVLVADYLVAENARMEIIVGVPKPSYYTGPTEQIINTTIRIPIVGGFRLKNVYAEGAGMYTRQPGDATRAFNDKFLYLTAVADVEVVSCGWKEFSGTGVAAAQCIRFKSDKCRGERTFSYGHVFNSGCDDVDVSSYTSIREFAAAETGGGKQGINTNIRFRDSVCYYPVAVGFNAKLATASITFDNLEVIGDLGESLRADGEGHLVPGITSHAPRTTAINCRVAHCGRGYEFELQGSAIGGGGDLVLDDLTADACLDYGFTFINADVLLPRMAIKGSISNIKCLNQRRYIDDATTLPSAAIFIRGYEGIIDLLDFDGVHIDENEAHGIVTTKTALGRVGRVRFGDRLFIGQSDAAKRGVATNQRVFFSVGSDVISASTAHNLVAGTHLQFATSGTLPSPLTVNKNYVVMADGLTARTFKVYDPSAIGVPAAIGMAGTGSGTCQIVNPTQTVTFDTTTDLASTPDVHGLVDGMYVQFTTDGYLPTTGLRPGVTFYVLEDDGLSSTTFRVAKARTENGQPNQLPVDVTGPVSGTTEIAASSQTVSFDATNNLIKTTTAHGLEKNDEVQFTITEGGYLPTKGLRPDKNYRVSSLGLAAKAFKVEGGGGVIDIAGVGSGTHSVVSTPARKKVMHYTGTLQVLPVPSAEVRLPYVSGAVSTGSEKAAKILRQDFFLVGAQAELLTPQASGDSLFTVDILADGVSLLSTKLMFGNGETLTTNAVVSTAVNRNLAAGTRITIVVGPIGDGTATGLDVTLLGVWTPPSLGDGTDLTIALSTPPGTQNQFYGAIPAVQGGTPPYRYNLFGVLPPGTSFSTSTGAISGPLTTTGVYSGKIRVIDALGVGKDAPFSIPVGAATPFSLAQLPGNAIVFDLDAAANVTADGSSKVSSWGAKTGTLTLGTSTAVEQPTLVPDGWATGIPVIRADGMSSGNILRSGAGSFTEKRWTLFAAARPNADQNTFSTVKTIFETARASDSLNSQLWMNRASVDSTQDKVYVTQFGGQTAIGGSGFGKGTQAVIVDRADGRASIAIGTNSKFAYVNGVTPGSATTTAGSTTRSQRKLFGSDDAASNRAAIDIARILEVDVDRLPGRAEQIGAMFLFEGMLAEAYGIRSNLRSNHPYRNRAPVATDYKTYSQNWQLWGNSIGAGVFGQVNTNGGFAAKGLTVSNGCKGGTTSSEIKQRFIDNLDSFSGMPVESGLSTQYVREKVTIFPELLYNNYIYSVDETTAKADIAYMIQQTEIAQSVSAGQGRIVLCLGWLGNGNPPTQDLSTVPALNNELKALYPNYFLDMNRPMRNLSAPGSSYADATAFAADKVPAVLRASTTDPVHLTATGYDEYRKIITQFVIAKGWMN